VRFRTLALTVLLLAGCREAATVAPKEHAAPKAAQVDVIALGNGTSVLSRTAEFSLQFSPLMMIDFDWESLWSSPAANPEQTVVFALAAPARIETIALRVTHLDFAVPQSIVFESSLDNRNWTPLATVHAKVTGDLQTFPIAPKEVRYVRLKTASTGRYSQVKILELRGRETGPPQQGAIEGCWTINGEPARFFLRDARILGIIGSKPILYFDGGTNGRTYNFAWARGPLRGHALLAVSPDGQHLSGMQWHEEVLADHIGDTWFGERAACNESLTLQGTEAALTFLRQSSYYPLFSLRFDGQERLDEAASHEILDLVSYIVAGSKEKRFELVAREFRHDAETNRAIAQKRIDAVRAAMARRNVDMTRLTFVAAGDRNARITPNNAALHALYNVVDLRIASDREKAKGKR
jgi:hypothetical protein